MEKQRGRQHKMIKMRRKNIEKCDQAYVDEKIQEKKKNEKRVKQLVREKRVIKKILKILTSWALCKSTF